jgi:hypothetical protein
VTTYVLIWRCPRCGRGILTEEERGRVSFVGLTMPVCTGFTNDEQQQHRMVGGFQMTLRDLFVVKVPDQ